MTAHLVMTPMRAAAYLGCGTLLAAWFASAAGIGTPAPVPVAEPQPVQTTGTETLADDVQAQAVRLREHLAVAPVPRHPARNPFSFASRSAPAPRTAPRSTAASTSANEPPVVVPEPILVLAGVASDQSPAGFVRTAIITGEGGEIFMVKVGEFVGGRYKVESIGTDTVELADLANSTMRRLTLK